MNKAIKIAIIRLSAIGDIVQSTIVLQFIKNHYPNTQITWIADEKFAEILHSHELIKNVVAVPLKAKKFVKTLQILSRLDKFDIAIDLQGLIKSAIIARLLSKNCFGFDKNSIKEPFASVFYSQKLACDYNENIIIRNLSLASFALNFSFTQDEILAKKPCLKSYKKTYKNEPKRILIAPFASENDKCYAKFKDVITQLSEYEIYICCANDDERKKAQQIAEKTHAKVLEQMSLNVLISFVNQCDLLIGNDSGITHMAWAQNIASITLFGNRPSQRNAYITKQNLTIDVGKKIDARRIDKSDLCINEILPQAIASAAKGLLG